MRSARRLHGAAVAVAGALLVLAPWSIALASPESERTFEDGKRLMDAGRVDEACKKFEESFAQDPLGGTLMGLAICHEKQGKIATAYREYDRARGIAQAAGRDDRVERALRAMAAIEARVPRLIIEVPSASRVQGLRISIDGVELAPDEWATALPVDPGTHAVTWAAPGKPDGKAEVSAKEGSRSRVDVVFGGDGTPASADAPEDDGLETLEIAAIATGATGIVALGVGTTLGIVALGAKSDSDAACNLDTDPPQCTDQGLADFDRGQSFALGADITLGVGIALVATSAVLFVISATDDGGEEAASATGVRVGGGPGDAGLSIVGGF